MAQEAKRVVCEFCHARCRVLMHIENNRLIKFEEDRSDPRVDSIYPATRGCLRLRGAKEWMYHPDHVNFPLKRAGERGEGKWVRIPWGQAFDEITEKLQGIKDKYGAEAVTGTCGTTRTRNFIARFFNLFGSPNLMEQGRICMGPSAQTSSAMFGRPIMVPLSEHLDIQAPGQKPGTKCILLIGLVPSQSMLRLWKSVRDARKAGYKIIVIDPRETESAKLADLWLQLRPGTDTALLMSMINVIIEEGLYDKEFVERWCYGFDKLADRARDYPPEKVAEITWVPADKIREAARILGESKPFYSGSGMGIEHLQHSIQALQAKLILAAVTGSVDADGGIYMRHFVMDLWEATERLSPEQKGKQLGADRFKFMCWPGYDLIVENTMPVWGTPHFAAVIVANAHAPTVYRAIITGKPYPVRAMITNFSNPMVTQANTKLVYKALKSLDLYVVTDYWLTPSAELADYVLPVASWLERPFFQFNYGGEQGLPCSIPGEYDHKTDYEIFRELGIRLGQEKDWPWKNLEEVYDYQLEPMGMSFKELMAKGGFNVPPRQYKKYEKVGFGTATGKAELYSTVLEKLGYDPLPKYEEPFETPLSRPDLAKEYPLILITGGRFRAMFHSEHRQVDSVRHSYPHPLVQVHPDTAKSLDIGDGDWVWIESPRGRIRMKCQHFRGIDPRVVHCEHGWWFPELPGEEPWLHGVWESNVNVLTDDEPDHCNQLSGGWPLKTALCKLYKVKQY